MSLPELLTLTSLEIIGDFGFKQFANKGGIISFAIGAIGYIGVVCALIVSLQNSTILMVNAAWDGISGLIESVLAYFVLGERLESKWQYLGILFISLGLYLLKIPMKKEKRFVLPKFF
jgi:multidrug transporter EmrE-like cation transporter